MSSKQKSKHQTLKQLAEQAAFYKDACIKQNHEICQILGKALDYPKYCEDQKNFPGATENDGVCVGDHVAETLAGEVARRLIAAEGTLRLFQKKLHRMMPIEKEND